MTTAPGSNCLFMGCGQLASFGSHYCDLHKPKPNKRSKDENRPSSAKRGYDRNWFKLRDSYLRAYPLCYRCHTEQGVVTPAMLVDHIVPIRHGGPRLDPENLQSLCNKCHHQKTQEDIKKYGYHGSWTQGED